MSARRQLLTLIVLVALVDAAALAVYWLAHLDRAGQDTRLGFTVAWVAVTLVVVLTRLRRMRIERDRARRAVPGGPRPGGPTPV